MANMQWYYAPYGEAEESLLAANVRMLSYDGFGLLRRQPESTRMPLLDGVHHLDEEIYEPERYMHLVLEITGTDYSDWKDEDDLLLDKLLILLRALLFQGVEAAQQTAGHRLRHALRRRDGARAREGPAHRGRRAVRDGVALRLIYFPAAARGGTVQR